MNTLTPVQQEIFETWFRNKQAEAYLWRKAKARKAKRDKFWQAVVLIATVAGGAVIVAIVGAMAILSTLILGVILT